MDYIEEKILGCLVGAAAGDALGAATEMRTRRQIEEKFGGRVKEFLTPPDDTFARGNMPGQVTDDFSLAYVTCLEILRHNGEITPEVSRAALLSWRSTTTFSNDSQAPPPERRWKNCGETSRLCRRAVSSWSMTTARPATEGP